MLYNLLLLLIYVSINMYDNYYDILYILINVCNNYYDILYICWLIYVIADIMGKHL